MSTRNSPRSQRRADIDTTLPYQNVKAAVRMFGEKVESRSVSKNEKNAQNQSGIQQLQEEMAAVKAKLADAEREKGRALSEIEELRKQLQLSTSTRSDDMNQTQCIVGSHAYLELELKKEREQHRSTLAALQICKDELNKLENEMAIMLKEKECAVRQVDEALTAAEVNARRAEELSNEISGTKESLVLMKMAYVEVNKEKEALIAARKAQNDEQERSSKELSVSTSPAEVPSTHSNNGESNGDDWKMLRNNLLATKRSLVNIGRLKVKDAAISAELEMAKGRLNKAIDNEASAHFILKELQEKLDDVTRELNLTKSQLSDLGDKENQARSESKLLLSELQRMKAELKSAVSCNEAIIGLHQKLQEMDVSDNAGQLVNALACNDNDVAKAELQAMLDEEAAALRQKMSHTDKLDDGNMQNASTDNQQTSCDDCDSTTGSSTTQQQVLSSISVSKDEAVSCINIMEEESIANMMNDGFTSSEHKKKKKTTLSSLGSFLSRKKSQRMNST